MLIRTCIAAVLVAAYGASSPPASSFDLVIAGTTDTHGRLRGWNYESNRPDTVRGLTRAATIVDSVRAAAPGRVILLDAGDLLQGNSMTYVAARVSPIRAAHPVMAGMNAMHYDAAAVGNHEFNYGIPFLERTLKQAKFPFLAANARRPNGKRAFPAWVMVKRGAVKVGVVGATTPGSMVWDRDNLRGKIVMHDIVPEVRTAVAEARKAGADVIVVTMHSGLTGASSYDTVATGVGSENVAARVAREVNGIDLILYGHSHAEVGDTVINGVLLMQPKNWATSVAVAHLSLERANNKWRVASKQSRVIQAVGHAESPSVLAATDAAHKATLAWTNAPLGNTVVAWRADSARVVDTPLIDFILDVERREAGTDLASTAAFSLDANLEPGPITAARMQALYPYDNTLRGIRITGAQLRAYLEQSAMYYLTAPDGRVSVDPKVPGFNFDVVSGVDYTIDVSKPAGSRVTRLERNGKPVGATDTFTMALNNYRQGGGGGYGMLAGAPVVYDKQTEIRQLLVDELRRKKTLVPSDYFVQNWRIEPATAVATLYKDQHRNMREDAHATGTSVPATRLRIIGTNDFHGALEPRVDASGKRRGGAAYLASAIHNLSKDCTPPSCETILLDGGDEFQGTPASNLAFGKPIVQVFNALGYAAGAVGNHEFDWGQDTLRARMREARYAMLAANVRYADGRDVPWIRDDTLIVRGALKIGVIGVATMSTPSTTKAANVADLRFVAPEPIVDSLTRDLRRRGADYVIVVAHSGAFCDRDGATNCNGEIVTFANALHEKIDAIVSGHTHSLVDADVKGIPIVQARSSGTAVEAVDLVPDRSRHHVFDVLPDSLTPDPAIASIVAEAVAKVAPLVNRPVATIAENMERNGNQYPLGNLIADAQRIIGKGDIGVMNNGGIRANLLAGAANYGTLFEVQPFGNVLYRVTVSGASLRAYMEKIVGKRLNAHISGAVVTFDTTRAPGNRILSMKMSDGSEVVPTKQYTVVFTDFLATGGDGLGITSDAIRVEPLSVADLDALIEYLRSLPQPIHPPTDARLIPRGAP